MKAQVIRPIYFEPMENRVEFSGVEEGIGKVSIDGEYIRIDVTLKKVPIPINGVKKMISKSLLKRLSPVH